MKTQLTTLLLACGTVVASPLSLNAQDARPPGPETIKPAQPLPPPPPSSRPDGGKPDGTRRPEAKRDEGRDREHDHKHDGPRGRHEGDRDRAHSGGREGAGEHRERPKAPEAKPVTYLGLLTRALSPEVAAQAGLPEGFGLLVADVMKDSPAKAAGFEKYDVIVLLGDQRIVNLQQFQALIRAQKKGDEVTLSVRRKGGEVKVSAKLGEHVMPAEIPPHGHPAFLGSRERFSEMRNRMDHFRKEMRERFEHRRDGQGARAHAGQPGRVPPCPGFAHGPMNRGGDRDNHQGPPNMQRGENRERDHAHGPQKGPSPHAKSPHGSGPRPDGPPHCGPRPGVNGPRPEGEGHRGGPHPFPGVGHDGNRNPVPHAGGPHGKGPLPDGPPHGDPRSGFNGPRPEGEGHRDGARPGPRDGDGHRDGARPDAPPPPGGGAPPPRA